MPMNAEKDVEGGAGTAVPPHRNGNQTSIRGKGPKEDKQRGETPARNGAGSALALQVAGTLKGLAKRAREEGKDAPTTGKLLVTCKGSPAPWVYYLKATP